MPTIGLYTATENELGAVGRAADEVDADLVVRSESDLDGPEDADAFVDDLEEATAVVLWLHGAEDSMPGYGHAVERLREAGVPLVVKATGDAFAIEDTTVDTATRDRVCDYLDRGGTANGGGLPPGPPGRELRETRRDPRPRHADCRRLVLRVPLDPREPPVRRRAGPGHRGAGRRRAPRVLQPRRG